MADIDAGDQVSSVGKLLVRLSSVNSGFLFHAQSLKVSVQSNKTCSLSLKC